MTPFKIEVYLGLMKQHPRFIYEIRYCDDFILCFQFREDAEKVMDVLTKRFEKYGSTLIELQSHIRRFDSPFSSTGSGLEEPEKNFFASEMMQFAPLSEDAEPAPELFTPWSIFFDSLTMLSVIQSMVFVCLTVLARPLTVVIASLTVLERLESSLFALIDDAQNGFDAALDGFDAGHNGKEPHQSLLDRALEDEEGGLCCKEHRQDPFEHAICASDHRQKAFDHGQSAIEHRQNALYPGQNDRERGVRLLKLCLEES
jgi:hypothetical protein